MKPNITRSARPPAAVQSPPSRATITAPATGANIPAPASSAPAPASAAPLAVSAVGTDGRVRQTLGPSFNKRNQQTIVRLTTQEKQALHELAYQEGLTMSELVRRKVLGDQVSF